MKIALIGYGKMGKEIETIAISRNHSIVYKFDLNNTEEFIPENLSKVDVAIEFTSPETAFENYLMCFKSEVPVVSGTTGWLDKFHDIKKICLKDKKAFFYASNFSIGVNILFKMNEQLAKIMNNYKNYEIGITETHHIEKKDAPSGTAITLAEGIVNNSDEKRNSIDKIPINSLRKVNIPGIHTIKYESDVDFIEITHSAKNRKGFALGAILAAEFIVGKKGFFSMDDLMKL